MQIDEVERDIWIATNADLLRAGNDAVQDLLPYINTTADAQEVRPLIARLEVAISEVTYSDFDRGLLSAICDRAGRDFRAGLAAMDAGDGELASRRLTAGLAEYHLALDVLTPAQDGRDPPARSRGRWWLVAAILLLIVVVL